jgi:hypothetical protein
MSCANAHYYIGHCSKFIRPGAQCVAAAPSRDWLPTTALKRHYVPSLLLLLLLGVFGPCPPEPETASTAETPKTAATPPAAPGGASGPEAMPRLAPPAAAVKTTYQLL